MLASVTPELINKVGDLETLKKLCVGILKQRDKFGREKQEMEAKVAQLQEDLGNLLQMKEKENVEGFEREQEIKVLKQKLEELEKPAGQVAQENESLQEVVNGLLKSKTESENRIFELRESQAALQKENQSLQEMVESLLQGKTKSELAVAEANAQREEAEKERESVKARNKEFLKAVKMMQGEINRLKGELEKSASQKDQENLISLEVGDEVKSELERQQEVSRKLAEECEKLKEELADLKRSDAPTQMDNVELSRCKKQMEEQGVLIEGLRTENQKLKMQTALAENMKVEIEGLKQQNLALKERIAIAADESSRMNEELENNRKMMQQKKNLVDENALDKVGITSGPPQLDGSQHEIDELKAQIRKLQEKIAMADAEKAKLSQEITLQLNQQALDKQTVEQKHTEAIESLTKKFETELAVLQREKLDIEGKYAVLEQNLTRITKENTVLDGKLKLAEHNLSVWQENSKQVEASRSTTSFQIEQLKSNVEELKAKNAEIYEQLSQNQETTDKAVAKARELEARNSVLESQLANLNNMSAENMSLKKKTEELEVVLHSNQELNATIAKKAEEYTQLNEKLESLTVLKSELEAKIQLLEGNLHNAKQACDQLAKENEELKPLINKADELVKVIGELATAQEKLDASVAKSTTLSNQLGELQAKHQEQEQRLNEAEQRCQMKDIEIMEAKNMSQESQDALEKKDKMIVKLKTLLQRAVNADQRKDQQIAALQSEMNALVQKAHGSAEGVDAANVETIVKLEKENRLLQQQLDEAKPSVELQEKNERLTKMLEKSNTLYAQVLSHNRELLARIDKTMKCNICRVDSFTMKPQDEVQQRQLKEKKRDEVVLVGTYLKSTLIQFFAQDAKSRGDLIPLILELVGCNEQQINAAKRQWERSNQLIQKTSGFF